MHLSKQAYNRLSLVHTASPFFSTLVWGLKLDPSLGVDDSMANGQIIRLYILRVRNVVGVCMRNGYTSQLEDLKILNASFVHIRYSSIICTYA